MSERAPPHWGEFEQRKPAPSERDDAAAELCARVFTSPDGKALLAWLRSVTIEKRAPSGSPEPVLRELEARRGLVQELEALRERGLASLANKKKSPT